MSTKTIKKCPVCGADFEAPPSGKITCSPECATRWRRQAHLGKSNTWSAEARQRLAERGQTENLAKGTAAALSYPHSGPFETNLNAQHWVLQSPDGQIYSFCNLALWCRQNAEALFQRSPAQVRSGILSLKRSQQGKLPRPANSYLGWTLIGYCE